MNWNKILAVIRREYMERVRTKAFWIGTFLIPIFFIGYIAIQIATSRKTSGERKIAVVDATGKLFGPLERDLRAREQERAQEPAPASSGADVEEAVSERPASSAMRRGRGIHWVLEQREAGPDLDKTKEALRREVLDKKIHGYLILDPEALTRERAEAEYHSTSVSEFVTLEELRESINRVMLKDKIAQRGLPPELSTELEKRVRLKTLTVSEEGSKEEKGGGIFAALMLMFIMYMTFFMYGFQNLKGVIEEKTNRIVEIVVASVRPTELMLGKIIGIGLVGLTQYLVWSLVAMNLSLPGIAGMMAGSEMGVPTIRFAVIGYFILFFLLGYFLYASIYTAIGAPFNTDQEAQQLAMVPGMFMVGVWAVFPAILNNPNGGTAVMASLFPMTAPLVMFMRTAIAQPPAWQIAASIVILILSTIAMAWIAGRIYRVGILMYGKKPTLPEIARWIRYSPGKSMQPAGVVEAK
jgi:ABC-2 type transport system permease protein